MDNVLTLITDPAQRTLCVSDIDGARQAIEALGGQCGPVDWLSADEAADLEFDGTEIEDAQGAVQKALNSAPIDVIAQRTLRRKKKLIIADMDSTIVQGETLDDLAEFAGLKDEIAEITRRAMNGEMDFIEALKARVSMLEGLSEVFLSETLSDVKLNPGARQLIATMRQNGAFTALISGGFSIFTDHVRETVGFHTSLGNKLDIQDGHLTGKVIAPIVTKDTKLEMLADMAAQHELSMSDTMAIGDGANDVPMLKAAGMGIAYHAHGVAQQNANACLNHAGLRGALFIQGYRRDEIIS